MKPSSALLIAGLLALGLACRAGAADQADRSTLEGYARWAESAIESLPEDVRALDELTARLAELTSERRREAGLPPLETDPDLLPAARAHALDMLERGYIGHVTPDGIDPGERVALLHRRLVGRVGENLAEQTGLNAEQLQGQMDILATKVMEGLMQSPEHRDNILDPDYTHLATAALAQGETVVVLQLFEERQALLAKPMPLEVSQGDELPLGFEGEAPAQYAYARPNQPAQELIPLELSTNEVPVGSGTYLLKFLFPTEQAGRLRVADGPAILVR